MEQVGRLLFTDPTLLPPQHRYLLEFDFKKLGAGLTPNHQYWLVNLESAVNAYQSITLTTLVQQPSTTLTATRLEASQIQEVPCAHT